ncbi:MAG TPA: hypothetical protein VK427_04425 [Kofleriaceae bacterium]|nr:hypothetical protein [Kofleriaceae bacterium]
MIQLAQSAGAAGGALDLDEALSTRLRDLALVDIDALVLGGRAELVSVFADDVADALKEARMRIAALRAQLGGADPLSLLDVPLRQRASDAAAAGATRVREKLATQADAARSLARLADLAGALVPKLFEADRRR